MPVVTPGSGLPSANGTQPSGATITPVVIKGADGREIHVKDFRASAKQDPYNEGNFYLQPTDGNTSYQIEYISATQFFNISLLEEPIGLARLRAEVYLKNTLGVSDSDLCALAYSVTVPNAVNTTYSGTNLGFSTCADAVKLH